MDMTAHGVVSENTAKDECKKKNTTVCMRQRKRILKFTPLSIPYLAPKCAFSAARHCRTVTAV